MHEGGENVVVHVDEVSTRLRDKNRLTFSKECHAVMTGLRIDHVYLATTRGPPHFRQDCESDLFTVIHLVDDNRDGCFAFPRSDHDASCTAKERLCCFLLTTETNSMWCLHEW